ncbi:putative RNA-binding protein, contains TRAM domain [Candidatus Methanoperedens nitroreducens]|uniref:Putative RNA-binding protein, contains TRAM domain n=1 Tax=Candidatus Methanoperedens nitratireducens TaxID=1392998 RepID=A0A062V7T9_9EURY|nr:TRAM domain-containing protein [Candidatus Methanoperedens nitroreducens]KCZ72643.1 putative RNA-binding protein, contains TRAM domain [Candidatus Methanoperedens nitroreducens]MDJ1423425.1 TRAM domain-containing protein [Candidatus Methanoperedens sp.]
MFTEQDKDAPVSAGAVHDVTIEGIAREGDGIARIRGFVIFVPGTKIGDQVKIKIERVMRKFAIASLEEGN